MTNVATVSRKKRLEAPLLTFLLALTIATGLGVIVYLTTSTLPFLAASPTTDPNFSAINQCLLTALPVNRVGFTVSPRAERAAAYTGTKLCVCARDVAPNTKAECHDVPGITHAAFGFDQALWFSRRFEPEQPPQLYRLENGVPVQAADAAPIALAGTFFGVVTLDANGRLVALAPDGSVLSVGEVGAPLETAELLVSDDGERIALTWGGGVSVFDARSLERKVREAPCQVERAWWRRGNHELLLACGGDGPFALALDTDTGTRETAPRLERPACVLVPGANLYVQECEHLPCTASSP